MTAKIGARRECGRIPQDMNNSQCAYGPGDLQAKESKWRRSATISQLIDDR